jgi:hypothetical protein
MTLMDVCLDRAESIATHNGLNGSGIKSQWGLDFLHLSRLVLGPTQPPIQWVLGHSQGKVARAWH